MTGPGAGRRSGVPCPVPFRDESIAIRVSIAP
jgi:hypothetical protein